MKKIVLVLLLIILIFPAYSLAANKFWWATALTGGTDALDGIDGANIVAGDGAIVALDSGSTTPKIYFYRCYESGTAESSPAVISPDSNAGNKRWHLMNVVANNYETGTNTGVALSGSNGSITFTGQGDGYDENIKLDFNTTENVVGVSSTSSVGAIRYSGTLKQEFGDSGTYINQSADGVLNITSDTEVKIVVNDEDLKFTKTGTDGVTIGTNTGVTRITTALQLVSTGYILGPIKVVAKSSDYTIGTDDANEAYGTLFVNTGASTRTFTLPSAVAGMSVCIKNAQGVAQILRLDAGADDYIVMSTGARTSAAAEYYGSTASAAALLCVVAVDSTDWHVMSERGTWAEE